MAPGNTCPDCGKRVAPGSVAAATLTPFPSAGGSTTGRPPSDEPLPGTGDETRLASPAERAGGREAAPAGSLAPGDAFGPRYRILRLLGAGGMGVVYHAWDEELGVAVALKVIRPEVSADPATAKELEKRFKRELLLARQVTHHNVVRIHDIGEVEGTKYITMSYIDGRDLATVLKSSGHLPVSETLPLIRQLAAGLQAAHDAGVIHRDLKPANIMVEGDAVVIMDFGIARSAVRHIEGGGAPGSMPLSRSALVTGATMQGAIVGTVAYMSPEQAKGQPADQRSDIYAVGMIMRDMLVGMRQIEDPTEALNELMARVRQAPTPVQDVDPAISDDVDRIVTKCLQPDPAARFQSVQELLADLNSLDNEGRPLPKVRQLTKRIVGAAALAVATLLGATFWLARTPPVPVQPDPISVLIADFENRTGDPVFRGSVEQALAVGLEGASFVNNFSRRDAVRVAAQIRPGSALNEETARLVARREGVKVVLAGAVVPSGSGFSITGRAVDVPSDIALAEVTVEADDKGQVLEAVAELAARIREQLGDTSLEDGHLSATETFTAGSLEAVQSYSQAQDLAARGKYDEALTFYRTATEQDPNFGRAYSGWATSAFYLGRSKEASEQYNRALSLVDRMTEREKLRTLGTYYLAVARNYEKAIENYSALVARYPADLSGHNNLAFAYFATLDFANAMAHGQKALEIYPSNVVVVNNFALYAMYAGDFERAAKEAERAIAIDPSFYKCYLVLAVAANARHDPAAARLAYERMAASGDTGKSVAALGLGDLAMAEGRYQEAERVLSASLAADVQANNEASLAAKHVALAELYAVTGRVPRAAAAARQSMKYGQSEAVVVPVAMTLARVGREREARELVKTLDANLQPQTRAYARVLEGMIALEARRFVEAVDALRAAQKLADVWLGRVGLGMAYIEAGHYAEGLAEIELASKRRGEGTAVFLDDMPTLRYLAALPYWLARAHEGLGARAAAVEQYRAFLAARGQAPNDPLVADARRRLASN